MYDQIEQYLPENSILYELQSGFRHGFSTDSYLNHLTNFIRFQMDKWNIVGMLLLDRKKAFDTVNHSIVLMSYRSLGVSSLAVLFVLVLPVVI